MIPTRALITCLAAALMATAVSAQTSAEKGAAPAAPATAKASDTAIPGGEPKYIRPETPEQRKERLGTPEDPGTNPDPAKVWGRFGKLYHILRYERKWANYQDVEPGTVRPFGFTNFTREIYQQNDRFVWVWDEIKPPAEPAADTVDEREVRAYGEAEMAYFQNARSEFSELTPPAANRTVTFVNSSEGLPQSGSWRNHLTVADMNGDGFADLVAPAERGGTNVPSIYLGDGKGKWTYWKSVKWPYGVSYGGVDAGDFNGDGKMDLVFGVHLGGLRVMLGDGNGVFTDASAGTYRDFATRRVQVVDVNADGKPDIVAINEGATTAGAVANYPKLMTFINDGTGKRWIPAPVSTPDTKLGGDFLTVGNFNGDKYPDLWASSIFFNGTELLWMSDGAARWKNEGATGKIVQFLSYYFAGTAGRFTKGSKLDDAIMTTVRVWPSDLNQKEVPLPSLSPLTSIERVSFDGKGNATRRGIMRWAGSRPVSGIVSGDFDGDGNLDVAFTRYDPRALEVLLGDGKGNFTRATVSGAQLLNNPNYDLRVADVNGDKRPDIIIMYEATGTTRFAERDGGIQVFLNQGTTPAGAGAAK